MKTGIAMNEDVVDLNAIWASGYSVSELWGRTEPVSRGGPAATNSYLIMWGILSIVDDQVSHGAGHQYLRERLWNGDWIAVGYLDQRLMVLPPIKDAKFGRKPSAIGDGIINFTDVRIIHAQLFEALGGSHN
ncbi:hypothetical protein V1282_006862 [Nitrobacteraceae bacterium AZCC 2146]|jgi:hypothetical protein